MKCRGGGSSLRVVRLRVESMIADRAGALIMRERAGGQGGQGMPAPREIFWILDVLRSNLVHFETLFQHGKSRVQTAANLLRGMYAHVHAERSFPGSTSQPIDHYACPSLVPRPGNEAIRCADYEVRKLQQNWYGLADPCANLVRLEPC